MTYKRSNRRRLGIEALESRALLAIGDLDGSFGVAGVLRDTVIQSSTSDESVAEILPRPEGGFYVAGTLGTGRGRSGIVFGFQSNGQLDANFGDGGHTLVPLASGTEQLVDMALQPDGKLVVAGVVADSRLQSEGVVAVGRLDRDGTIDTSFGNAGLVYTHFAFHAPANAVVVRPTGEIVVLSVQFDSVHLLQYRPDGTLDTSFSEDGITDYALDGVSSAGELELLDDGSVVVSVSRRTSEGNYAVRLIKYLEDGAQDASFGGSGLFEYPVASQVRNGSYSLPLRFARTTDGDILLAGTSRVDEVHDYFAIKLTTDGVVDDQFGVDGVTTVPVHGMLGTAVHDVVVRSDGTIVLVGSNVQARTRQTLAVYLSPSGGAAVGFPNQGIVTLGNPTSGFGATAPVNDRLVFAASTAGAFPTRDLQLLAINATGALDSSFGTAGRVVINLENTWSNSEARDVVELPDGKLLVAMGIYATDNASRPKVLLARYTPSGLPDQGYGASGKQVVSDVSIYAGGMMPHFERTATAVFLVALDGSDLRIGKLTPLGELDASFGTDGWLTWAWRTTYTMIQDVLITEHAIFLAGPGRFRVENGVSLQPNVIAKLDFDGNLDADYGTAGLVELPVRYQYAGSGIRIESHGVGGVLVLSGNHPNDQPFTVNITRLNPDGVVDQGFGNGGRIVTSLDTGTALDTRRAVHVLPDDSFLVMGTRSTGGLNARVRVEKYDADGKLVTGFGSSGLIEVPITIPGQEPYGLAADSEGRIVVSSAVIDNLATGTAVTRFLPSGALDTSFGNAGSSFYPLGRFSESAYNLTIGQHDDIIIAGSEVGASDTHTIVARIVGSGPDPSLWHNGFTAEDANGDRSVSPIDALIVINYLNRNFEARLPNLKLEEDFIDVNNDGFATALDALLIINRLNSSSEGESDKGSGQVDANTDLLLMSGFQATEEGAQRRRDLHHDRYFENSFE